MDWDEVAALDGPEVFIGTPARAHAVTPAEEADAYTSKIGGRPAWLRPTTADGSSASELRASARCPRCRRAGDLRLLAQLYCPIGVHDRALYVLLCAACSTPDDSCVCAFRAALYNAEYEEPVPAQKGGATDGPAGSLFAVDADEEDGWGDEEQAPAPTAAPAAAPAPAAPPAPVTFPAATPAMNAAYWSALRQAPLPAMLLDTFPEPAAPSAKERGRGHHGAERSVAEQLAEAEALFPGSTAVPDGPVAADDLHKAARSGGAARIVTDDDTPGETPEERALAAFVGRLERCPSQCVRWSPDGVPLVSSATRPPPPARAVPPCGLCGAPRRFEAQLLSPMLYFFEQQAPQAEGGKKGSGKGPAPPSKAEPHFGTVSVYTCSDDCTAADATVALEFCHVEPEL